MSQWKCIICGTVMSSKCPSQRSEFYGPQAGLIRNLLMTDIIHTGPSQREVFISLTDFDTDGDPVVKAIEFLNQHIDDLKSVTCNHRFVLNSETETTCELGCDHYNLNDADDLRKGMGYPDYTEKPSFQRVLNQYQQYIGTILGRMNVDARRNIPQVTDGDPDYDKHRNHYFCFQDDVHSLQYRVSKMVQRLEAGQSVKETYRVVFGRKSGIPEICTDDLNQAVRIAQSYQSDGIDVQIYEHYQDGTHYSESRVAHTKGIEMTCDLCGEFIPHGNVLVTEDGRFRHPKCQKKQDDKFRTISRSFHVNLDMELWQKLERRYDHWENAMEEYFRRKLRQDVELEVLHAGMGRMVDRMHVRVKAFGITIDKIKEVCK